MADGSVWLAKAWWLAACTSSVTRVRTWLGLSSSDSDSDKTNRPTVHYIAHIAIIERWTWFQMGIMRLPCSFLSLGRIVEALLGQSHSLCQACDCIQLSSRTRRPTNSSLHSAKGRAIVRIHSLRPWPALRSKPSPPYPGVSPSQNESIVSLADPPQFWVLISTHASSNISSSLNQPISSLTLSAPCCPIQADRMLPPPTDLLVSQPLAYPSSLHL